MFGKAFLHGHNIPGLECDQRSEDEKASAADIGFYPRHLLMGGDIANVTDIVFDNNRKSGTLPIFSVIKNGS